MILPPTGLDSSCRFLESYLLDGEVYGRISMSCFRVLCTFSRGGVTHAAMLTSRSHKNVDHLAPSSVLSQAAVGLL